MHRSPWRPDGSVYDDADGRKVVTTVHQSIYSAAHKTVRVASWIRRNYPRSAPDRGHSYLIALCGTDYAAR
jgi:hypothetical protein